jgi:hypothetical protein
VNPTVLLELPNRVEVCTKMPMAMPWRMIGVKSLCAVEERAYDTHLLPLVEEALSRPGFAAATKTQRAWFRELTSVHMLSTNCILWTRQTPCAKCSFGFEAGGYLLAPAGGRL